MLETIVFGVQNFSIGAFSIFFLTSFDQNVSNPDMPDGISIGEGAGRRDRRFSKKSKNPIFENMILS